MATESWIGGTGDWSAANGWLLNGVMGSFNSGIGNGDIIEIPGVSTVAIASTETYILPYYALLQVGDGTNSSALNVFGNIVTRGNTEIKPASTLTIEAGGIANFGYNYLTVDSGGTFNSYGNTSITSNIATNINGAALISGATASLTASYTVNVGTTGSLNVENGSTASVAYLNVNTGGTVDVGASSSLSWTGSLNVDGNVTVEGVLIPPSSLNITTNTGGTITVNGGQLGTSTVPTYFTSRVVIENGGTVYLTNAGSSEGSIQFIAPTNGGTNTLVVAQQTNTVATPISGFGPGSVIQFPDNMNLSITGVTITDGATSGTYKVALVQNGSVQITLSDVTFAAGITPVKNNDGTYGTNGTGTYTVAGITDSVLNAANGTYELNSCFLAGTLISTPNGPVPVEQLQPGDLVTVLNGAQPMHKPVKWIGHRSVSPGAAAGAEAYPVRIKQNAFADQMPQRDLLLTDEHCVFIENGLVPVRMLVNHRSIISDRSFTSYIYYHVELEDHGILLAEGLPVESYLDTGNRGNFANAPVPFLVPQLGTKTLPVDAMQIAAPLLVDVAVVKPIWDRLAARAAVLGMKSQSALAALSHDPELYLRTNEGDAIQPLKTEGNIVTFSIPAGTQAVTLVSRTSRPCDVIGAYVDDRRALGVSVGAIYLQSDHGRVAVNAHFEHEALSGWHAPEGTTHRWTNGLALLPLGIAAHQHDMSLHITIMHAGPYLNTTAVADALAA